MQPKGNVLILGAREGTENMGEAIAKHMEEYWWNVRTHDCYFGGAQKGSQEHPYQVPLWENYYYDMGALVITLGRTVVEKFTEGDREDVIDEVLRACLTLPLHAAREYIRQRGERGGRVVFVGSYAFDHAITYGTAYCAAKAGLDMAARSLAWDYSKQGFSFFTVHPYHVPGTPMWEFVQSRVMETRGWTREEADEYAMQNLRQPSPLSTSEIAMVVQWLLESPAARWLSGAGVPLYGGTR